MEDDLFKRKFAYPYEKGKTIESYYKPLKLGREDYFSTLKQSYPDFEETIRTQAIIVKNRITNLKELTMLYLKNDVLLLTDIFQNYIDTCKKAYGINPLYSYSTPSFTWKAGLKMTGVKLDYIIYDKLRLLLENNMRGGPSACMGNRYVKRGERKIVYEDLNNLYGWSMSQYLPTGDFREIKVTRSNIKSILRTPDNDDHGFLIECDLEYPDSIHKKKTKHFAFLPEKKTVKVEKFSPYMMRNKPEKYKPTEKLIMDQTNKHRYFLHYRDLKFYIRHGIKILNIHTVYKFKQSPWLAKNIKYNTEQRKKAKTEFEKHFYKLMNNSFYGKTIENIRKRLNLDLIDKSDIHRILNRQSKLSFDDKIAEYEKFNLYSFHKETIKFTKPIYVGFCVLELSKLLMYEWYYDKIQPYFEDNLELHYLDTDSFIFSIKPIESLIEDLKHFKEDFDFSDLDPSHELYSETNKKVIGKKKLETAPELDLDEAVFLRSKSYSLNIKQNNSKCKHKGVQDHNKYTLEDYKFCLDNNEIKYGVNYSFRSNKHEIAMVKQKKIALNTFDDKRCYIDKYISIPWGYNPPQNIDFKN